MVKLRVSYPGGYIFEAEGDTEREVMKLLDLWKETLPMFLKREMFRH